MQALVWQGPGIMESLEVSEPTPTKHEVVVKIAAAGICGSDVSAYVGTMGLSKPGAIRGHELAGTVVSAGSAEGNALIGRRVAINPVVSCGQCWACEGGAENVCTKLQLVGVHRAGGFAERVALPITNVSEIGDDISWTMGATAEPLAQACHDIRLAQQTVSPQNALIIGAGAIGLLLTNAARLLGIEDIVVQEPNHGRRQHAIDAGALLAVTSGDEAAEATAALPRGGFDVVFDVVGTAETRVAATQLTRNAGAVILVGLHDDVTELPWFPVIRREVIIRGANCFTRADFATSVDWLHNETIVYPTDDRVASLADGADIFARLAAGQTTSGMKMYLSA